VFTRIAEGDVISPANIITIPSTDDFFKQLVIRKVRQFVHRWLVICVLSVIAPSPRDNVWRVVSMGYAGPITPTKRRKMSLDQRQQTNNLACPPNHASLVVSGLSLGIA